LNLRLRVSVYIILCLALTAMAIVSCRNNAATDTLPAPLTFAPPVVQPLKLSAPKKIDFNAFKSVAVQLEVKPFDMAKLPVHTYDTGAYKAVKYRPEEAKFDINAMPSKSLDIDKLPSKPLKFKTYALNPPKLIRAGARRLINRKMSVYEIGEEQGLKADSILSTFTDRDGFEWIGTDKGLYRYDGENFWRFDNLPHKSAIFSILQDERGQIWMGNFNAGIQVIDLKKGTVKTLDAKTGLNTDTVSMMTFDNKQRIWLASYSTGITIIDLQHQTIKSLTRKDGLSGDTDPTILQDADHNIWLGSTWGSALDYIDLKNKKISYINTKYWLKGNSISTLLCDHNRRVWVATWSGGPISVIDLHKRSIQTINESANVINTTDRLFEDKQWRIWAGKQNNGVEIIDPERQTRIYLDNAGDLSAKLVWQISQDTRGQIWLAELNKLNVIETDQVFLDQIGGAPTTALFEDSKGLVWRAGDYDGINIIDRKEKTIRTLNSANGLKYDTMMFVKEYKGKIFFSDVASLYMLDSGRSSMTTISKKHGNASAVRGCTIDNYGNIWIASEHDGIEVYYPGSRTMKYLGGGNQIDDICTDKAGRIWISILYDGIFIIDPDKSTMQSMVYAPLNEGEKLLLPDKDGNVWIASQNGLLEVSLAKKTLTLLTARQGLIDKGVNSVLGYGNRIYAGTMKGMTVVSPPGSTGKNRNWQFESFGAFLGFDKKNNDVQSNLVTHDGQYWIGDQGIKVFKLPAQDTSNYPVYIAGLNIVDKPRFFMGDAPAKADGLAWDNVEGTANMPVNLHIAYDQNFMQFHYGTLNPSGHDSVLYRYRLIGTDKDWNEITSATSTPNYINLGPGNYTFEVTSLRYDRSWSKAAKFSFTINPPWWQTWWAYVLYAIALGGSIWGFSHYRSLQLIKDKRILEHKVHIRTEEVMQQKEEIEAQRDDLEKAFGELKTTQTQLIQSEKMASLGELTAGIAHEIQNPLNFVNNFSEVNTELIGEMKEEIAKGDLEEIKTIAGDIEENSKKINMHGKRADAIVKSMLQHSQSGSATKELTDMNALADEYLRLSYHGLRAKDKEFNAVMTTNYDPDLPKVNAMAQDIGRVLLNLFNNAFYAINQKQKTAGADYKPEVSVSTSSENGQVIIKVKDNGTGIPDAIKGKIMQPFFTTKPTGEGTGLGLSLTYDMVVKGHGGSIAVDTKEGDFTEFIIRLPIG
jgi:signal transduction histidine kinase/ligand-binding sensor domain-containing protein